MRITDSSEELINCIDISVTVTSYENDNYNVFLAEDTAVEVIIIEIVAVALTVQENVTFRICESAGCSSVEVLVIHHILVIIVEIILEEIHSVRIAVELDPLIVEVTVVAIDVVLGV